MSARLNIAVGSGAAGGVGLNISVFNISAAASRNDNQDENKSSDSSTASVATETKNDINKDIVVAPAIEELFVYREILQNSFASPRTAALSSNDSVYVIRPTGAFIVPSILRAGTYILVPSTFQPITCKYILDVHISPFIVQLDSFKFVKIN